MSEAALLFLIPLAPLAGVLINGAIGRRLARALLGPLACLAALVSFGAAALLLTRLLALPDAARLIRHEYYDWLFAGDFAARFALRFDPLSATMALVVTGVGLLIHIYSIGYMAHDPGPRRFFAYLNLFLAAMLILVLADNFVLMFVGWEGVGLCSYLLIGFWFHKPSAAAAGRKAFVVNRIGDFGFLLAIFLIYSALGSVDYGPVFEDAGRLAGSAAALAIPLLLFVGAIGKSAQIPLYVWLPDAMEGPTPVSALIHAATMVTAGVYMVARCAALYELAPLAQTVVAVTGVLTALLAATIGLAQFDIKRVLAYSTVSQLGYMFVAVGVGAYSAGIFHLVTHAFFKALLFLGAGAVIHALHEQQDLRRMGGLKAKLPITYWTMLIATLAISGLPPLSGFFSKDAILAAAFEHAWLLWGLGTVTAALTSFYMFRLMLLAFHGQSREPHAYQRAHEAPAVMWLPLALLAAGAALSGTLGVPEFLGGSNRLARFLAPVVGAPETHLSHAAELGLTAVAIAAALLGLGLAYLRYQRRENPLAGEEQGAARQLLIHKYYVDEAYGRLFVQPTFALAQALWRGFDVVVIDGAVNGLAKLAALAGRGLGRLQTGRVPTYISILLLGAVALLWAWVGRWVF